jgi:hypothetical protein
MHPDEGGYGHLARYKPAHLGRDESSVRAAPPRTRGRHRWLIPALVVVVLASGAAAAGVVVSSRTGEPTTADLPGNAIEHEASPSAPPSTVAATASGLEGVTAAWVQAENAKPGSAGWRLANPAKHGEIEGYANHVSITAGQPVDLFVSTIAPNFHVEAYRMGYYVQGARLVWHSDDLPGVTQAKPVFTPRINMIEDHWQPSLSVATDGWPEGDYLFKLVASTGQQEYVPLTVRNDNSKATYLIINAVTTWQAYNLYGGYDLYSGLTGGSKGATDFAHRSRVVSYDRPMQLADGAGDFLGLEFPFLNQVEAKGLDVTYATDIDVHEHPELLLNHKAIFTMGHDEYYSMAMRNGLQNARDHGVNLAFLGANTMFRHIRFEASPLGADRHEICYKNAAEDPLHGKDNADVTVDWREPPTNLPESEIIGDLYQCNPVYTNMVITDSSDWLFAGTGATDGQVLTNVIGSEYDRYIPDVRGPANVDILTHSPVTCRGKADFADATYYSAPSGAGVFASGTIYFVGKIDVNCPEPGCPGRVLGRLMQNLLVAFGAGPAGLLHPSTGARPAADSQPAAHSVITASRAVRRSTTVPRRSR